MIAERNPAARARGKPLDVLFMPAFQAGNPYQQKLADGLSANGVRVRMARRYRHLFPFLESALLGGPRPRVFHLHWTHNYLYWPRGQHASRVMALRMLLQIRLLRRLGIRIVWTAHNIAAHDREGRETETRISRRLARLCDAIIVHCNAARETAIEALDIAPTDQHRVVVIPHGPFIGAYPEELSRDAARASFGFSPTDRVFLLFGRLRAYKGVEDLLEAFRVLPDGNARLLIAGKPFTAELKADIERLAASDGRVTARLEFVPDDEIQRYMRAADVAVFPFRDILTSGSVVLAMSYGLPIIAPRVGCVPETVGDGGILYDPTSGDALAAALRSALAADLSEMGSRNRATMEALSWEDVGARTVALAYTG